MNVNAYISVVAVLVSAIATTVTVVHIRRFGYLGRMPVLVISYAGEQERWVISNVGHGPAINIKVAQQDDVDDEWYNPVVVPAIAAGESFTLEWLKDEGEFSLGARYSSYLDVNRSRTFFTRTRDDQCAIYPANRLPSWTMPDYSTSQVRRHWERDLPISRPQPQQQLSPS